MKKLIVLIGITILLGTVGVTRVSASQVLPVDLAGEVKVSASLPPGQQRPHRTAIPVQAIVLVTITSEADTTSLKEMIFTNTKLALWVPTGRYSVSAEIGPPTVNPKPEQCGKARLVVAKGKQTSFHLACVLR